MGNIVNERRRAAGSGGITNLFQGFTLKPAHTILLSFLFVILVGTLLLMLPMSTPAIGGAGGAGKSGAGGLSPIDALFTSTSAVCVTGLIVVDTAGAFSLWGKIVLLLLIQIGGLGIMILSYFTLFSARQRVSLEEKMMLSYMLSEENMNRLSKRIASIIYATFIIEALGALLLLPAFSAARGDAGDALFFAVFHAVSAFCNAGFALFSDSLESFGGNPLVNGTVAVLIIIGGLSFSVIVEVSGRGACYLKRLWFSVSEAFRRGGKKRLFEDRRSFYPAPPKKFSLNSRVVLIGTGLLLVLGMLLMYLTEHTGTLAQLPTGRQYLAAFFQSVTLRTAGFNTLPIGELATGTLLIMMLFMFIGAAQGSTAGGIKINTLAVIYSYVQSVLSGRSDVVLYRYSISPEHVQKAFLVLLFGFISIAGGSIILTFTETAPLQELLFETVSAFGTVGLSTGITGRLSTAGKLVIIVLMFLGRLGPLTILAAAARPNKGVTASLPRGDISI